MTALSTFRRALRAAILATISVLASGLAAADAQVRIKDLVDFEGVRGNDLVGYGLVVGLNGTGDDMGDAPFTQDALSSLLERLGMSVQGEEIEPENVAAVVVTATLPPFARTGSRIDVNVAAIGTAESLLGGTLIMTPLNAADGEIYAVAQGPIIAGGFTAGGDAAALVEGVPTSGIVPSGARVEREVAYEFGDMDTIRLAVRDPDFTTAARIEEAINAAFGRSIATMLDAGTVSLASGAHVARSPAHLIGQLENINVAPAQRARVVIDQRSGTIVLGADVRISQVAVAQGNLTIRVEEAPGVSQPNPFSEGGETVEMPRTDIYVNDGRENRIGLLEENVTLADLVGGLNALGIGPRGMIDILTAIDAAGALHAEIVMQ